MAKKSIIHSNTLEKIFAEESIFFGEAETPVSQPIADNLSDLDRIQLEITATEAEIKTRFSPNTSVTMADAESSFSIDNINYPDEYFFTLPDTGWKVSSPRYRFLRNKLLALKNKKSELEVSTVPDAEEEVEKSSNGFLTFLNAIKKPFDIIKKLIDILDDATNAIGRAFLSPLQIAKILPYIVGPVGIVIHSAEGVQGGWDAIKAIKNEKSHIRWTRIIIGGIVFAAGGTGVGLSISYLLGALGLTVNGLALMPALIPAMLLVNFIATEIKLGYSLHKRKEKEANTRNKLEQLKLLPEKIKQLQAEKEKLMANNWKILSADVSPEIKQKYKSQFAQNNRRIAQISDEIFNKDVQLTELKRKEFSLKVKLNNLTNMRLQDERDVAFKSAEILASSIVLPGVIMGSAALLAFIGIGSAASFGALPVAMIATGVAIGVGIKLYEWLDGRGYELAYLTDKIEKNETNKEVSKETFYVRMEGDRLKFTVKSPKNKIVSDFIESRDLITMMGREKYEDLKKNFDINKLTPYMSTILSETSKLGYTQPWWKGASHLKHTASNWMRAQFKNIFSPDQEPVIDYADAINSIGTKKKKPGVNVLHLNIQDPTVTKKETFQLMRENDQWVSRKTKEKMTYKVIPQKISYFGSHGQVTKQVQKTRPVKKSDLRPAVNSSVTRKDISVLMIENNQEVSRKIGEKETRHAIPQIVTHFGSHGQITEQVQKTRPVKKSDLRAAANRR